MIVIYFIWADPGNGIVLKQFGRSLGNGGMKQGKVDSHIRIYMSNIHKNSTDT